MITSETALIRSLCSHSRIVGSSSTTAWLKSQDPTTVLQADKNLFVKGLHRARREIKHGYPRPVDVSMAIEWARIDGYVGKLCKEVERLIKEVSQISSAY